MEHMVHLFRKQIEILIINKFILRFINPNIEKHFSSQKQKNIFHLA
jgi:hypothetical protein